MEECKTKTEQMQPDSQEVLSLLRQMEAENADQARYARKQYRMSCIWTAASVLTLVLVVVLAAVFVPQLRNILDQANVVLENLEATTGELSTLMPQLSQSLPALVENLDALVDTSAQEIVSALQKVSSLDVDSLNTSIRDLQSIVEPLARLFGSR